MALLPLAALAIKALAATEIVGTTTNINQLKAAAATVTETATMTAMRTATMKTKVMAVLVAAQHWRRKRGDIGQCGNMAAVVAVGTWRQRRRQCCNGRKCVLHYW